MAVGNGICQTVCGNHAHVWHRHLLVCRQCERAAYLDIPRADEIIPVEESIHMVNRVNACGGHARLTICEGYTHDCWTDTYAREDIYEWLLSHRRQH